MSEINQAMISIRSLVKRETHGHSSLVQIPGNFNPLPRKEGDFITHLPHQITEHFNPLPRKEGDSLAVARLTLYGVFQSTPS